MTVTIDPGVEPSAPDRAAELDNAQLRLEVAVSQLVQPGIERLDRDDPATSPAAAELAREVAAEHEAAKRRLQMRHKAQMAAANTAAAEAERAAQPVEGETDDEADRRRTYVRQRKQVAADHYDEARETLRRIVDLGRRIGERTRQRLAREAAVPSLVDQLIEAIPGGGDSDHGRPSAGSTRAAVALDVVELVHAMQEATRCRTLRGLSEALRAWAQQARHWRTGNPEYLLQAASAAEAWVSTGRTLLNPPKRWSFMAACPQCETSVTHVRDSSGEVVRRPALELDPATGTARCLAPGCGARWDSRRLLLLAQVLEEQQRAKAEAG